MKGLFLLAEMTHENQPAFTHQREILGTNH